MYLKLIFWEAATWLGLFYGLLSILTILLVRSLTTFVHEMGHALPALLFSKDKVTVYVGSYGDPEGSWRWQWGRLSLFLKFRVWAWDLGVCMHQPVASRWQTALIILGGPLSSVLLAMPMIIYLSNYSELTYYQFIPAIFVVSAFLDLIVNLNPVSSGNMINGIRSVGTDGSQLLQLIRERNYPSEYFSALKTWQENGAEKALPLFLDSLAQKQDRYLYRRAIDCALEANDQEEAITLFNNFRSRYQLKTADQARLGALYLQLKRPHDAIESLSRAIYEDYRNVDYLHDRAKAYFELADYDRALDDLRAALNYGPGSVDLYLLRAVTYARNSQLAEAEADLQLLQQVIPESPHLFVAWAWYHREMNSPKKALEYLDRLPKTFDIPHQLQYWRDQQLNVE